LSVFLFAAGAVAGAITDVNGLPLHRSLCSPHGTASVPSQTILFPV